MCKKPYVGTEVGGCLIKGGRATEGSKLPDRRPDPSVSFQRHVHAMPRDRKRERESENPKPGERERDREFEVWTAPLYAQPEEGSVVQSLSESKRDEGPTNPKPPRTPKPSIPKCLDL